MKISDLKREDLPFVSGLSEQEMFIRNHGNFNCKYLWFKDSQSILDALKNAYPNEKISEKQRHFIFDNAQQKMVCYLCHSWESNPDIFVFGDDNIAFTLECFRTELINP